MVFWTTNDTDSKQNCYRMVLLRIFKILYKIPRQPIACGSPGKFEHEHKLRWPYKRSLELVYRPTDCTIEIFKLYWVNNGAGYDLTIIHTMDGTIVIIRSTAQWQLEVSTNMDSFFASKTLRCSPLSTTVSHIPSTIWLCFSTRLQLLLPGATIPQWFKSTIRQGKAIGGFILSGATIRLTFDLAGVAQLHRSTAYRFYPCFPALQLQHFICARLEMQEIDKSYRGIEDY